MPESKTVLVTDVRGFANPVIAQRLKRAGARVAAVDPSIPSDGEEDGIALVAWSEPAAMVEAAVARLGGRLDAIVISPALPAPRTPVDSFTAQSLASYFDRVAIEPLLFASAAARVMRTRKSGRIVFGTSSGPIGGIPGFVAYAAARSAVNGAVRSLALELAADGISVNAVAPNFIQTETYYPKALLADPVRGPKLVARVPMGRLGEADEVAALVELLALGDAGFVSGQVIPISGAWC
ncbi:MAG: SDR family oxidoreductase [Alphaproteobacteria bacterium]|nr:SDR family oxidoreductase [Alphaproteobacteria bacterium]